ncbi:lipopolysaccharide kinase InaA family protein [Aestuariibaculum suncheonense]|uniref:Kdo domain containing protein n=1 Tax=Aestuariibaculum suncheonense TaxID=1028745 RepID=A0A8J6Q646_9FLAO|nr:lipopolysaccharide kinase InaA family protein [Aestuariibaculum suncheonense]MBD0834919.1 Kdo domain containing protein [Aestuariibaculum suncheonense]
MKKVFVEAYKSKEKEVLEIIDNFDYQGNEIGNQDRNTIKTFTFYNEVLNVKAFKIPNIFNQIAYKFLRKSKAQRSFEYANKLISLSVGTPKPIAYLEQTTSLLFKRSFYISEHLECDLTYRELTKQFDYPNYDPILRAFTRFTYSLHEKGIHFLDHSPGNTLIRKEGEEYKFYLVDLNRMNFGNLDFETRIKNFSRLTIHKSMVEVMSDEYAKVSGYDYAKVFNLMWKETCDFQERFHRKKRLKKKLKFWKKN